MAFSFSILVAAALSQDSQSLLSHIHSAFGCTADQVQSGKELSDCLRKKRPDIILVDASSTDSGFGMTGIKKLRKTYPDLLVIPLIPAEHRALVQELLALDMFLYIYTPVEQAETFIALTRAGEHLSKTTVQAHRATNSKEKAFHGMIGASTPMQKLFDLIFRVAEDDESTVLIRGESGTGKEMVAKAIHLQSSRNHKNFVPVNCAAIPDDLLESELFGYTKGAFTGATSNKTGRIQYADGGTLFLDEIGDMKPSLQAKLLRVLQEKEFEPVGSLKATPVDTRILAATHCDLEQLVNEGEFREDLYYRLSVIPLNLPSLKERNEDIPLLIDTFIETYTIKRNREPFVFSPAALAALVHFDWRGNVRELENLIQHMSILYSGKTVEFDDLPGKFSCMREIAEKSAGMIQDNNRHTANTDRSSSTADSLADVDWDNGQVDFKELINSFETQLIVKAMEISEGNKKEAARLLNLKRTTLLEKIKKKELNSLWEK